MQVWCENTIQIQIASWEDVGYGEDPNAFIFSLVNNDNFSQMTSQGDIKPDNENDRKLEENDGDSNDEENDGKTDDEENDGKTDDEENDGKTDDEENDGKTDDEENDGKTDDEENDGKTDDEENGGKTDDEENDNLKPESIIFIQWQIFSHSDTQKWRKNRKRRKNWKLYIYKK